MGRLKLHTLLLAWMALIATPVFSQINLAGVYEGDERRLAVRKQMYLTLDFINGTPDFTQVFFDKEHEFKILPKDFMNAKKLKKNFAGTTAPGFGKFKQKLLLSTTDEFRITDPRMEDGVINAKWETARGEKGECVIIANPDRSLRILGLTEISRDISPDDLVLKLVEDRLPAGKEPFVTPPAVAEFVIGEYEKNLINPTVKSIADDIDMQVYRAVQYGDRIEIEMRVRNMTAYEDLVLCPYPGFSPDGVATSADGRHYTDFAIEYEGKTGPRREVPIKKGKWNGFKIIINNVKGRVDGLSTLRMECRCAGILPPDPYLTIENLPVFQSEMPDDIRPAASRKPDSGTQAGTESPAEAMGDALVLPAGRLVRIDKDNVNLRKAPDTSAPVETTGSAGQYLIWLGEENGWYKVLNYDGEPPVYVSATVSTPVNTKPVRLTGSKPGEGVKFRNYTLNKDPQYGFESETFLTFSGDDKTVQMDWFGQATYMTGRIVDVDSRYQGSVYPGYIGFTEKTQGYHSEWEPIGYTVRVYGGETPNTVIYNGVVYERYEFDPATAGWVKSK